MSNQTTADATPSITATPSLVEPKVLLQVRYHDGSGQQYVISKARALSLLRDLALCMEEML